MLDVNKLIEDSKKELATQNCGYTLTNAALLEKAKSLESIAYMGTAITDLILADLQPVFGKNIILDVACVVNNEGEIGPGFCELVRRVYIQYHKHPYLPFTNVAWNEARDMETLLFQGWVSRVLTRIELHKELQVPSENERLNLLDSYVSFLATGKRPMNAEQMAMMPIFEGEQTYVGYVLETIRSLREKEQPKPQSVNIIYFNKGWKK